MLVRSLSITIHLARARSKVKNDYLIKLLGRLNHFMMLKREKCADSVIEQ